MKRLPRKVHGEIISAVLYEDDLKAIIGLFQKACDDVRIVVAGHELTDSASLRDLPAGPTHDLEISGNWPRPGSQAYPRAALFTQRGGFQVYLADGDDMEAQGLRVLVEARLRTREVTEARYSGMPTMLLVFFGAVGALAAYVVASDSPIFFVFLTWVVVTGTLSNLFSLRDVRRLLSRAGIVHLGPRPPEPASFIQANRDRLILILIQAVATAILALVVVVIADALDLQVRVP